MEKGYSKEERVVIGIDPASGDKGSYVFAPDVNDPDPAKNRGRGIDRSMTPSELRTLLPSRNAREECGRKPFHTEACLVCWDAPLTGLQDPDALEIEEESSQKESLTTRPIERTGAKVKPEYQSVARATGEPGVSIRGFSGLSHWVITRNVLGLPRVGRFDAPYDELPLFPVFEKEEVANHNWAITEVHPTLAVYLWLKGRLAGDKTLWRQYKGSGKESDVVEAVQAMWEILHNQFLNEERYSELSAPMSDDAFDARVAWLLGYVWLHETGVEIVGTEQDGSFLLPKE